MLPPWHIIQPTLDNRDNIGYVYDCGSFAMYYSSHLQCTAVCCSNHVSTLYSYFEWILWLMLVQMAEILVLKFCVTDTM